MIQNTLQSVLVLCVLVPCYSGTILCVPWPIPSLASLLECAFLDCNDSFVQGRKAYLVPVNTTDLGVRNEWFQRFDTADVVSLLRAGGGEEGCLCKLFPAKAVFAQHLPHWDPGLFPNLLLCE